MMVRRRARNVDPLRRTLGLRGTPPQAAAHRGIAALNQRVIDQMQRRAAERARIDRERRKMVAPLMELMRQDKRAMQAAQNRRRLTVRTAKPKISYPRVLQRIETHVRTGSFLTLIAPPYDLAWGANSSSDQTTWGTWVAEKAPPDPRINSTTNIGNGGSAWSSAGVGMWFIPAAFSAWVRIGIYAPYDYNWRDDSTWATAHTDGFIAVYVQSFDLNGGDPRDEVDRRISLWSDGSADLDDHADSGSGYYPSDTYFMATNARQYAVWAWCNTSADGSSGTVIYSYAFGTLSVPVPFMVFEQWT